jgi:hypothetical protein
MIYRNEYPIYPHIKKGELLKTMECDEKLTMFRVGRLVSCFLFFQERAAFLVHFMEESREPRDKEANPCIDSFERLREHSRRFLTYTVYGLQTLNVETFDRMLVQLIESIYEAVLLKNMRVELFERRRERNNNLEDYYFESSKLGACF